MVRVMNRRGNAVLDSITVIILLFALAVLAPVGYVLFSDLNTDIQNDDSFSTIAKTASSDMHTRYPSVMDGLFVFAFVLFWALSLVASFMIDSHPIFFIFAIILLACCLFVAAEMSNAFEEIGQDSDIDIDIFPMTKFIMFHLVEFLVGVALTIALVLYGKNKYIT